MRRLILLIACTAALSSCGEKNPGTVDAGSAEPTAGDQKPVAEESFLEDIDATRAGELTKQPASPVVLDVRTPEEFAEGHIAGAINIDFKAATFKDDLAKLDPEQTYLFHCRSGARSTAAKPAFKELGFKRLYHLDGGFLAWEKAGLPAEK